MPAENIQKIIDRARDILVGMIPDPKGQIDQITNALIYKFMNDMDQETEEMGGKPAYFINGMEKFSWNKLFDSKLNNQQRANLYAQGIEKLSTAKHLQPLFRDIFKDASVSFRAPDIIDLFLNEINKFPPYQNNSEDLGAAFEHLLYSMSTQGKAGQFRTPRHIINFIVEVVAPNKTDKILDPACGTAGFLVSAYQHIAKKYKNLAQKEKATLANNIKGFDLDPQMAKLARVNLYLHGFKEPKIFENDTLSNDESWGDKHHVILANPPFMTPTGGIIPHKKFTTNANRAEVLFVDYIGEQLLHKGRAGIIVPEGIIFQMAGAYKDLRKKLIEDWGLYAIVSLPSGVFSPYSGVKTSILFLDRGFSSNDILFVKAENDGYDLGAQRRKIDKNDLPAALSVIQQWKQKQTISAECKALAHNVSKEKIAENKEYNFTGERYRETVDYSNAKWSMVELGGISEISSGNSAPQNKVLFKDGKHPFCRTSDVGRVHISDNLTEIRDYLNDDGIKGLTLFKKNTILFPKSGASTFLNHRVILGLDSYVSSHLATIYANHKKILSKFLFYVLLFVDARKLTSEQAYPSLKLSEISKIKIPLPPLEVQEKIAAEIDGYQKVIGGAKQVIANWKPNFRIDPNWETVELGKVCEIESGSRQKGGALNSGIPSIGGEQINADGSLRLNKMKYVSKEHFNSMKKGILKNKDVLIVKDGATTGKTGYFSNEFAKGAVNEHVFIFRAKDNILPYYLYKTIRSSTFQEILKKYIKGIIGGISLEIKGIQIPLPSMEVQEQIVSEIEAEKRAITECKILIAKMERKIADKIGEIWGNNI